MPAALAFDVYGTLIDTHGVVAKLANLIGADAQAFSRVWRDKQLEYSFRRGLMQDYADFAVCTAQALDWTNAAFGDPLTAEQKSALLVTYRTLPAFPDVPPALDRLDAAGLPIFAFSNGKAEAVDGLLVAAGIRQRFRGIVSVDDLRSFKPNPEVYRHFLRRAGVGADDAWMISGNPFDVIGAARAGMHTAWIKRSPAAVFDPWGVAPSMTVATLVEFSEIITAGDG